jgi:hypothetical protein
MTTLPRQQDYFTRFYSLSAEHEEKFQNMMKNIFDLKMDRTTTTLMGMMALFSVSHAELQVPVIGLRKFWASASLFLKKTLKQLVLTFLYTSELFSHEGCLILGRDSNPDLSILRNIGPERAEARARAGLDVSTFRLNATSFDLFELCNPPNRTPDTKSLKLLLSESSSKKKLTREGSKNFFFFISFHCAPR